MKTEKAKQSADNNNSPNKVCRFADIEEHAFFIYQGVKLCKFGCYGMGMDANGTIAKKLSDDTEVVRTSLL